MADNTILPGTGEIYAADDISGVKYQRIKLVSGGEGVNSGDVSTENPFPVSNIDKISTDNSTNTLLTNGSTFTGVWEDVSNYGSLVAAVKTDQNGTFYVQYSPDGINTDSTLTRYYRVGQIEAPHRFTNTRQYARVVFTNDSGLDQTFLRLQVTLGTRSDLNAPSDSVLSQDFDATVVRPTDYHTEVALGLRQGITTWNKFGYNQDIDTGSPEVVASWGGSFTPLTVATTLTISSSSTDDDGSPAGTGCNSIVIYGIDDNRDELIELVTLNGTTDVVTTSTWLGINRVVMFLCGSGQVNSGNINITATTGGSQMAQMPSGGGVTQQCIFHVPRNHKFVAEWVRINVLNRNKDAELTVKMWIWSAISNGKQEVYKVDIDTATTNDISENPTLPFPIDGSTVIWLEIETDTSNIIANGRFSGELTKESGAS